MSLGWPVPFALPPDYTLELGIGTVVRPGRDIVLVGAGPWLLSNAYHAAERLQAEHGVHARVIDLPWLNRVDAAWLREAVGDAQRVFTLDNHYVDGGQGQMLASRIAQLGLAVPVTAIGVRELPVCGTNDEVLAHHQLDVGGLVSAVAAALKA